MSVSFRNLLVILAFPTCALAQYGEFEVHTNGFVYPDSTMVQLSAIVADRNLEFQSCDAYRSYHSIPQARGTWLTLTGTQSHEAGKRLREGEIAQEDLESTYPTLEVTSKKYLLSLRSYVNSEGVAMSQLQGEDFSSYRKEIRIVGGSKALMADEKTVFLELDTDYNGKMTCEFIRLEAPFTSQELPVKYAEDIRYSDCLIDTTQRVNLADNRSYDAMDKWYQGSARQAFYKALMIGIDTAGTSPGEKWTLESHQLSDPDDNISERILCVLTESIRQSPALKSKLNDALEEAMKPEAANVNQLLLNLSEAFISGATYFELDRRRRVIGFCSQDRAPRYHAISLARQAASQAHWSTFLRAHLNILNDRFERFSDGSYAWAQRQTYIAELEALDINIENLLSGISLVHDQPSGEHYFANYRRLGRAYADSEYSMTYLNSLMSRIANTELDDYNRGVAYVIARNAILYDRALTSATKRALLLQCIQKLPGYMGASALNKFGDLGID